MGRAAPTPPPWPEHESRAEDEALLAALILRDDQEMSYGKIAKQFGLTRNAMISRLRRIDLQDAKAHGEAM
jgi:DNA-directed RNA polymerase specialized sigma24 family protein